MFVSPGVQDKGIGKQLRDKAESLRKKLSLTVYRENEKNIWFYRKCMFKALRKEVTCTRDMFKYLWSTVHKCISRIALPVSR